MNEFMIPLALVVGLAYEIPQYTVSENEDTQALCEDPLGCSIYADGRCLILLSPLADKDILSRQRMECIMKHNDTIGDYRAVRL